MKNARRESLRRAMVGPIQVVSDFKDHFLILWELKIQIRRKNWRTRKHNQERIVKQRRKRRHSQVCYTPKGGPMAIAKAEFQKLVSLIQVQVEPKNGEGKGEK